MGTHGREGERFIREYVMVERRKVRLRAEQAIEELISLLDELEEDPDFEDDGTAEDDIDHRAEWRAGC